MLFRVIVCVSYYWALLSVKSLYIVHILTVGNIQNMCSLYTRSSELDHYHMSDVIPFPLWSRY